MKSEFFTLKTRFGQPRAVVAMVVACTTPVFGSAALAQTQVVKPPVVQYWMDVATMSMAGMDDMPSLGALGNLVPGMAGMGGPNFGATRGMVPGRWLDLAVLTQRKPEGTEATQSIPPGQKMGPSLVLLPVQAQAKTPSRQGGAGPDEMPERPKGRILLYWGCSDTVRAGQPRVLDFSAAAMEDYGKFMVGRAVRDTGAKADLGHSIWPNEKNRQSVPANASLVGQHAISGEGLPASLKFILEAPQDFMPKLGLTTSAGGDSATALTWQALPTAQAYFLNAMGAVDNKGQTDTVMWSSSEVQEPGWGLMDYASNANVDQWLQEKVLLPATQTQCAVPAGIFAKAQGATLRGIAYGHELNLAYPPRPADKKVAWEPEWAAKVRVKSVAMLTLGEASRSAAASPSPEPKVNGTAQEKSKIPAIPGMPDLGRALKGLLGR